MDDKDTMNTLKITSAMTLLILAIATVQAAGVSVPYWDTPGNENPLYLNPGETKEIQFELQNKAGSEDLTFKTSITEGSEFAEITDRSSSYLVTKGTVQKVNIRIEVPKTAAIGDHYKIRVKADTTPTSAQEGQFAISSSIENAFDVVVSEKQAETLEPQQKQIVGSTKALLILVGIAILVIAAIIIIRRHNS